MIPIRLKFQAFGPYPGAQEIDFAALRHAGLFLIRGETGAGKTVILDAITYALYGRSSGGGRGDLTGMRCQQADAGTQTEVVFEWEAGDRMLRFVRTLQPRKKRTGVIEYLPKQDAFFRNANGDWEPFFENPRLRDVEELAVRLTGLQYDQFRQVVILPQGQFERLLVAPSDEKERLLTSLFGTGGWGRAADLLGERANALARETDETGRSLQAILSENECETHEAMTARIRTLDDACKHAGMKTEALRARVQAGQQALAQAAALDHQFSQWDGANAALAALREQEPEVARWRGLLRLRSLAELYRRWQAADDSYAKARDDVVFCEAQRAGLDSELKKTRELRTVTLEQAAKHREMGERLPELEAELRRLEALEEKAVELAHKMGVMQQLRFERIDCANAYEKAVLEADRAMEIYDKQLRYELASGLRPKKPCPVCGSVTHPKPAPPPQEQIEREEVDRLNAVVTAADHALTACVEKYNAMMEQFMVERKKMLDEGDCTAEDLAKARHAVTNARQHRAQAEQSMQKADRLEQRIEQQMKQMQPVEEKLRQAVSAAARAEETARQLAGQLDEADPDGALRAQLAGQLENEEFAALEQRIEAYDRRLAETQALAAALEAQLRGQTRPPVALLRQEADRLSEQLAAEERKTAVLQRDLEHLSADAQRYETLLGRYQTQRRQSEKAMAFARLLRGVTGVSLQRYVLGAMLSAVTAEANLLLERVHDGRYQIFRTLETTGNVRKAGLELEVLDRRSGMRRSVVSLSGGEKFLVALALSIGLSAVVQAQSGASRLGAIFIDEGFGTLDDASLHDALSVLASIRDTHGMVGIISHVSLLRESIHAGIQVEKRQEGSRLTVFYE